METLSWERLDEHLEKALPALLSMGGTRGVQIGFDPSSNRLFLRIPLEEGAVVPASPYAELVVEARSVGAASVLEISASAPHLYREFHRLAGLLAEELEQGGSTAVGAFLVVADRWRELTAVRQLLSAEERLGLFGELALLQGLIRQHGPMAVESWTARAAELAERHDFRVQSIDIEVKSTRSARRHHVIHGLRQLEPTPGHVLFLLSLRYEAAGMNSGYSLVDRVSMISEALSVSPRSLESFESKLSAARYLHADAAHYRERLIAADTPMLIPVDSTCPRLVQAAISDSIGIDLASRIDSDVTYRINVEGLGTPLDHDRGMAALGSLLVE